MHKISIIIPVYKAESYLRTCLDSVTAQTITNWECILIDDGSPDGSGAICDEYATKDSRFHVIHKSNGGAGSARNAGLDFASGDYVCFVDSDDYISPDYLESFGCKSDLDLYVQGGTLANKGSSKKYTFDPEETSTSKRIAEIVTEVMPFYPQGLSFRASMSKLYKRSIIGDVRLDTSVHYAEDYLFNLQILKKIHSLGLANGCGYNYLQDNSYLSNQKFDISRYLDWFDKVQSALYDLSISWNHLVLYNEVSNIRVNWLASQVFNQKYTIAERRIIAHYIKHFYKDKKNRQIKSDRSTCYVKYLPVNTFFFVIYGFYNRIRTRI